MIRAALALLALSVSPAQAQGRICLTSPEAESIALVVMPDILRQTGVLCAARLPVASPLRSGGDLIARYDREAERAWPAAKAAILKLSVPQADLLLGSDFARPIVATLVAPLVVGRIAVADCGTVDRLVSLLAPLPPRNTAGVLVTLLQYLKSQKARGKTVDTPDLPLCEATR